jgi:hypothetical protein
MRKPENEGESLTVNPLRNQQMQAGLTYAGLHWSTQIDLTAWLASAAAVPAHLPSGQLAKCSRLRSPYSSA